jgi:hypothetical protein
MNQGHLLGLSSGGGQMGELEDADTLMEDAS